MRAFPTAEEIDEYNALTDDEIRAKRKKHKVWAIKNGISNIKDTAGQIISTASKKTFLASIIGLGAIGMCTGLFTKEPVSAVLGIVFGGTIGTLGVIYLKDENEYIGVIDHLRYLKVNIKDMYWNIKNTNAYYPLSDEKKGRSL